jgi:hypothetical protein
MVVPLRVFGLNPSRRAIFITSGEGSAEASLVALAGFESAAARAAGVDGAVADEGGADDAGALGADEVWAGAWAPHGAAAITKIDARKTLR